MYTREIGDEPRPSPCEPRKGVIGSSATVQPGQGTPAVLLVPRTTGRSDRRIGRGETSTVRKRQWRAAAMEEARWARWQRSRRPRADALPQADGDARFAPPKSASWFASARVPDGTIYRALENLFVLCGERLSYRALDVEQIGSVYETMMGFRLEVAEGRSLTIKPAKRGGAPATCLG